MANTALEMSLSDGPTNDPDREHAASSGIFDSRDITTSGGAVRLHTTKADSMPLIDSGELCDSDCQDCD